MEAVQAKKHTHTSVVVLVLTDSRGACRLDHLGRNQECRGGRRQRFTQEHSALLNVCFLILHEKAARGDVKSSVRRDDDIPNTQLILPWNFQRWNLSS